MPAGTGTFVLGTRDVEIDHNTYTNNFTSSFSVVSYFVAVPSWTAAQDPAYNPVSKRVYFHDNTLTGNGVQPDLNTQLGQLLVSGKSAGVYPHGHVPEILVDGIADAAGPVAGAPQGDPTYLCFGNNGTVDFANMHFDQIKSDGSNFAQILTFDASAYACTLPALAPVSF